MSGTANSPDGLAAALRQLETRDAQLGADAEQRVRDRYGAPGAESMSGYDFEHSSSRETQASSRIEWVHQPWLRPIRFAYRHLPKWLRYLVKKAAN
jgi:hypothetical protein